MSRPYIVASFDDDNLKTSASRAIVEDAKRKVLEGDVDKDGFLQQFGRVPAPDYAIVSNVFHVVIGINLIVLAVLEQQLIHDPETMAFVLKLIVDVLFEPGVGRVVSQALTATDNNIQSLATRIGYAFTTQTSDSDAIASSVRHHLRPLVPRLAGAVHASEIAYRVNTQPAPNLNPAYLPRWDVNNIAPEDESTPLGRVLNLLQPHFIRPQHDESHGVDSLDDDEGVHDSEDANDSYNIDSASAEDVDDDVFIPEGIDMPGAFGLPNCSNSTSERWRRLVFIGRTAIWPYCVLYGLFLRKPDQFLSRYLELAYDVFRHDRFTCFLLLAYNCLNSFPLNPPPPLTSIYGTEFQADAWHCRFAAMFLNGRRSACLRFMDELCEAALPVFINIVKKEILQIYTTTDEYRAPPKRARISDEDDVATAPPNGQSVAPRPSTSSKPKKKKHRKNANTSVAVTVEPTSVAGTTNSAETPNSVDVS